MLQKVRKYQYFYRFELENVSIYITAYLHLVWHNPSMPKYALEYTRDQLLNLQKALIGLPCEEIRMKIQTENFFRILIWTRLANHYTTNVAFKFERWQSKIFLVTLTIHNPPLHHLGFWPGKQLFYRILPLCFSRFRWIYRKKVV